MNAVVEIQAAELALPAPSREAILRFEAFLKQFGEGELPLKHTFADGNYARECLLPADSFIVGKIHKHAHLNIVVRGLVTVVSEFGRQTIDAREWPVTFESKPGTKRALYVHEDTVWITVHKTLSTDLAEIEREIIAADYAQLDEFLAGKLKVQCEAPQCLPKTG